MGKFEESYRRLNEAQRQAVDTIEGPVLVIAGPGTGKTQLLSLRVANILRRTDANPGSILCLTYTESGQAAMRERLSELLGKEAKGLEIHTFHGFGSHLIGRFPEYFPDLAGARPADDLALYEVLRSCLERLPRNNPLAKMSYGQFVYQSDAATRISQLKQAGITPEDALDKAQKDTEWIRTSGRKITHAFADIGRLSPKATTILQEKLKGLLNESNDGVAKYCIDELTAALADSETSGKTAQLSAFKRKWLVSETGQLYFKPADQLRKILALAELYEMYEKELRQRKLFDFDDMILYALHSLETNREFLASVQETYQYILADEYQDTNTAQAKIITLIADNPVNESRPNVMVVGDDDQAIYGFQGALGDVLLYFRERWRNVTTITLKNNYRSSQTIIDTARAVITHGQNRLENYYEDIDKSLLAQSDQPGIEPFMTETAAADMVMRKALAAAQSASKDNQLAIIATKHKYLRELADLLDAAKVRYYYEGREDLLQDQAVQNLLQLAELALAIKQQDYGRTNYILPQLMTTDVLDIKRMTAWEIATTAHLKKVSWWQVLSDHTSGDAAAASKALQISSDSIDINRALASLEVIARQYGLRVLRKAKGLVTHAQKYFARSEIGLSELLHYAQLCLQAGISLSEKVVKGRSDAPVILLSAHKSKGLEFERVHVLHADHYTWLKEKGRRNNITLPAGWNHIEPSQETLDDRLRLLYVVITRAKKELGFIRSHVSRSGRPADDLPGLENIKVNQHISEQLQAFAIEPEESWHSWYLPHTPHEQAELQRLLKPVIATYRLSPTHLTTFLDVARGGPALFLTMYLLGIPEPPHPEAVFGNRVHETLHFAQQQLNKTGKLPTDSQLASHIKEVFETSSEQTTDLVEVISNFLKHTTVLKPGGVGEYSFSKRQLAFEQIRLTGTADHYVKLAESLLVTDFKTGRALNSWRVSEDYYKQKLHRFRQQLLFYELLFELDPDFADIKKIELCVAFIEPSRRDVYYQLILEADKPERLLLKNLLKVVWQHITTVNLPQTSTYSPDFSGQQAFEADLINEAI